MRFSPLASISPWQITDGHKFVGFGVFHKFVIFKAGRLEAEAERQQNTKIVTQKISNWNEWSNKSRNQRQIEKIFNQTPIV